MVKKRQYPKRKSTNPMMTFSGKYRSDDYFESALKNIKVTISKPKKKK